MISRVLAVLLTLGWLLGPTFSPVWAQDAAPSATPPAAAPVDLAADTIADLTARDWLAGKLSGTLEEALSAASQPGDAQLNALRKFLLFAKPSPRTTVAFDLRTLAGASPEQRLYRYPLSVEGEDATLSVRLEKTGGVWQARSARESPNVTLIPGEVFTPVGAWTFVALTALLAWALVTPTLWRTWVRESLIVTRAHLGVFLGTNFVLYGLFVVGTILGWSQPKFVELFQEFAAGALAQGGLEKLATSGVASGAFGITLNNLRAGVLVNFIGGFLFAVPAYLLMFGQTLFYGFVLSPVGLPLVSFLLHIPTIIVEFAAYFYVVAASGIMLARIVRRTPYPQALRDYAKCLPVAITVLVIAAWYESFEVLVLIPLLTR
jgi:Stage II sporulation protein M